MAESKLNKTLYTDINKLKTWSRSEKPIRFILEKSPFKDEDDDDDDDNKQDSATNSRSYVILGRILPQSDLYKCAAFQIELKLTHSFPGDPPEVRFLTPIYHPNVDKDGTFCSDLIIKTGKWKMNKSLVDVVKIVVDTIDTPEFNNPIRPILGVEYVNNRAEFNRIAMEDAKKHGLPRT